MDAERWRRIEELYHSALSRSPGERAQFVLQACGGDQNLFHEVESLLVQAEGDDTFLEVPAIQVAGKGVAMAVGAAVAGTHVSAPFLPAQLGRYRIVRILGEGGMGLVYEAEQDQPRRGVALKVVKPGFATEEALRRFEHEAKALGRLQHPAIAQIYEASTADTGYGQQPYFAMELIRGLPLTKYSDALHLGPRERLALTVKICEGVQHAHERGLIHRDLKPGNILVDETGQPKILDFGVARVTEVEAQATRQTDVGQMVGTLAYMSPEQVLADPADLDPRSDVYSLGVILYELLTGHLPHDVSNKQLHEAVRSILELEPTSISSFGRQYRGDIEIIVGKALEREKTRRYASAAAFAADIQRYLSNEPITARPPSAAYQLQKFTRRHRALVGGVLSVFVVLMAGIMVSTQQAIRANRAGQAALRERDRAETEAKTAEAVQQFIEDIFNTNSTSQSDPLKARQTTARQLLDIGSQKIDTELKNSPAAKERMLGILSELYYGLGLSEPAVDLDRKRVAAAKAAFGPHDPRVAAALSSLASSLHASRSVNEREAVLLEAKSILDKSGDFTSTTRGQLLCTLAEHYQSSDKQKALGYAGQAVDLYRKAAPDGALLAGALYQQGEILSFAGQDEKAVKALSEAVEIARKEGPAGSPSLPMYAATLGESNISLMQYDAAQQNLELAAKTARALNGDEHVDTFETEARLGDFFSQISHFPEALTHVKRAYNVCLKTKGADDPFYLPQMSIIYGRSLAGSGRLEEGLVFISQAVESRRKTRPNTRYFAQILSTQASLLADLAGYKQARQNLDLADQISKSVGFANGSDYTSARLKLAFAENNLTTASSLIESTYGPLPDQAPLSLNLLRNLLWRAELALLKADPANAETLAARASGLIKQSSIRPYLKFWETRAALAEGNAYLLLQQPAQSLAHLQQASDLASEMYQPGSVQKLPVEASLGIAYFQMGDRRRAAQSLADANSMRRSHKSLGEQYERPLRMLRQKFVTASH